MSLCRAYNVITLSMEMAMTQVFWRTISPIMVQLRPPTALVQPMLHIVLTAVHNT